MIWIKNAIITACDAKYGDFLVNHWLRSLKENVNLNNTEIVIFDYGLDDHHLSFLKKEDVIIIKGVKDGHITCVRFRDMSNYLSKRHYEQVMCTDGGDIIFQTDISSLLNINKDNFRVVVEDINIVGKLYTEKYFKKKDEIKIKKLLVNKNPINAGFIIGPADKFRDLCKSAFDLIEKKEKFGPDQVAINYLLYSQKNFVILDNKYNFLIWTTNQDFYIKQGGFYLKNGEKISVVHNAGRFNKLRFIKNFGYGSGFNEIVKSKYLIRKFLIWFLR